MNQMLTILALDAHHLALRREAETARLAARTRRSTRRERSPAPVARRRSLRLLLRTAPRA